MDDGESVEFASCWLNDLPMVAGVVSCLGRPAMVGF